MERNVESRVASFIAERIDATKKQHEDIAKNAGFEQPEMIAMITHGITQVPLDKAGDLADALEVEPLHLFKMCIEEYYPQTWKRLSPELEMAITNDERKIIVGLRNYIGGSYLAGITSESKKFLKIFLDSLRTPSGVH